MPPSAGGRALRRTAAHECLSPSNHAEPMEVQPKANPRAPPRGPIAQGLLVRNRAGPYHAHDAWPVDVAQSWTWGPGTASSSGGARDNVVRSGICVIYSAGAPVWLKADWAVDVPVPVAQWLSSPGRNPEHDSAAAARQLDHSARTSLRRFALQNQRLEIGCAMKP